MEELHWKGSRGLAYPKASIKGIMELIKGTNKDPKVNLANCRNFAKDFFVVKKIWGESRNDVFSFYNVSLFLFSCADAAKTKHLTSAEIHAPMQTG